MAALEQVLDFKTMSFEDIVVLLKAYEECVALEEEIQEDQGKLMYANMESHLNCGSNGDNRGRFRGGRF